MAKSQKRSNKEVKKPKAVKAPAAAPAALMFAKGTTSPASKRPPKKKG